MNQKLYERFRAAGWHLLISIAVAVAVVVLVFVVWFPGAYQEMAGGRDLLILVVLVDVIIGPLLTFAVFNTKKSQRHLRRDVATIVLLQISALAYGLFSVYLARPVALVFEHDRFRVISAAEVLDSELPQALPEYRSLSLTGPITLAVRKAGKGSESTDSLLAAALSGVDTSQRPKFWIPYGLTEQSDAVKAGRPLGQLLEKYPDASKPLAELLSDGQVSIESTVFLPVRAKRDAVIVLNRDGDVVGFLPFDGYF